MRSPGRTTTSPSPASPPSEPAAAGAAGRRRIRDAPPRALSHLKRLEAESIHVFREVAAQFERPVMLYSMGKDSSVMLRLARKAFHPGGIPFPLLHIDTTWKFREMIAFRDRLTKEPGIDLIVHTNQDGIRDGVTPFTHGSAHYTDVMKTRALRQALERHGFDAALGGARRDEERSRAKERVFSFRDSRHRWDPADQRPELWNVCNGRIGRGESVRAFPLSNWTELDVWHYILLNGIEVVPLYFAKPRPVVDVGGADIMVDDERMPLAGAVATKTVRFRTLGCYPLTGAMESRAATVPQIIGEMLRATRSERQHRLIDTDRPGSMEEKKRKGYF